MFDGFSETTDTQGRKRVFASSGAAVVVCLLIGVGMAAIASQREPKREEKVVEVAFYKPPPPPPPMAKPPAPKKKRQKRKAEASSAKKAVDVSTPDAIPDELLAEGDEADFEATGSVADITNTAIGGLGGGSAAVAPPPADGPRGPRVLPDEAEPPRPRSQNREPDYPESARQAGIEGLVTIRVVITADGRVKNPQVMSGQEPFVSAALAAIRDWRYEPAEFDGNPISVYRMIRIPFRLSK